MMTKLSKCMLYVSSYRLVYILIVTLTICHDYADADEIIEGGVIGKVWEATRSDRILLGTLIVLIVFSSVYIRMFLSQENNTRIREKVETNTVWESFSLLCANIIIVILTSINSENGIYISLAIFVIGGFVFVLSDKIQSSPIFLLHCYKSYSCGKKCILTKMSREKFNIQVEEEPDGIEARELVAGVYIIFERKKRTQ